MKLTKPQFKALSILWVWPGLTPAWLAKKMWGHLDSAKRSYRCGHGSHRGGVLYLTAGSYLAKLKKKGWVYHSMEGSGARSWYLTQQGQRVLDEHRKKTHKGFDWDKLKPDGNDAATRLDRGK